MYEFLSKTLKRWRENLQTDPKWSHKPTESARFAKPKLAMTVTTPRLRAFVTAMNAQTLQNHRSRYSGFTLVELIVVIVILGALAAAALPKFMNLKSEAQTAAVTQLAGTLRSAAEMFKMKCIASGGTANTLGSLTLNGVTRAVWYCYPVENSRGNGWWGINELVNTQGFDYTYQTTPYPGKAYFSPTGATDAANCRVTYIYQEPTSPLTITTTTSGC